MNAQRDVEQYAQTYLDDYGFERTMVHYRRRLVLERIRNTGARRILEVGCGAELVYDDYLRSSAPVDLWVIVEPAETFARAAQERNLPNAAVIRGAAEESLEELRKAFAGTPPDFILCSALLHEVTSAEALLAGLAGLMGPDTVLHVNVPNALSFHRRLAVAMQLIENPAEMSERNRSHLHHRVYDPQSFSAALEQAGLSIVSSGGFFVKPFTHGQMQEIAASLGEKVLDGLDALGRQDRKSVV